MARHIYVYDDVGYEGELELFRHAHVSAQSATASVALIGAKPAFLYWVNDSKDPLLTDDEVAVHRYLAGHPSARISIVPMAR